MPRLELYLFGPPRVVLAGQPRATDRRKALALFVYLALAGSGRTAQSRQELAALLWPDYPPASALAYLRRALWEINQALGEGWLIAERDTVALNPSADLWIDVARFQACLSACRGASLACSACLPLLEEAGKLYGGGFLAGFSLKDAPAFDEWTFFQAEALRREAAQVFEHHSACLSAAGQPGAAVPLAQRWLELDQLNEAAHRRLMQLHAQAGQPGAALRQYRACVATLQAELGVSPQPETTALFERIRAGADPVPAAEGSPSAPVPTSPVAPAEPLLAYATTFVGRETELAELARLLADPACRLVTLTGPGGVGKTRLAVQAAEAQRAAFADGVFFVPLAAVPDASLIVPALAGALDYAYFGTAGTPDKQKRQLLDFLQEKRALLLFDNFELLLPQPAAVDFLDDVLAAAPRLKLLTTSRERLNLQHEWVLPVGSLQPPHGRSGAVPQLDDSAVRLFAQAARKAGAGFSPTEADLPAIGRIVALVDGLPLGVELAAAWTKVLSCAEIASEIARSRDFLATPLRDVPARHRSLRAVFDYSWHLLPDFEQEPLRRLSVFSGSFTREAAEAVAGAGLAALASLVDKSLLYRRAAGRFELHDLVKQYAGERLSPADLEQTRERHSSYYADLAAGFGLRLRGHGQREALDALAGEMENIRAGVQFALERRDVRLLERCLSGLFWFYEMTSRTQEGYDLVEQVMGQFPLVPDASPGGQRLAGLLLVWHGQMAGRLGRAPEAVRELYDGMVSLQQQGPAARDAAAEAALIGLQWMGLGLFRDADEERRWALETLAYYRAQGDRWGEAQILWVEAWTRPREDEDLEPYYRRSLEIQREIGDRHRAARSLNWLGEYYHHIGQYAAARRCFEESMLIAREFGDHWTESLSQDYSGFVARRMGDYDVARAHHAESLRLSREIGDRLGQAGSLDNLGLVAFELGDLDEARRLWHTSLEMRRTAGELWSLAISLGHLADLILANSDPQASSGPALVEAEATLAEALALAPEWHATRISLVDLRLRQGRLPEAEREARAALRATLESNDLPLVTRALSRLASLHLAWGENVRAAELFALVVEHPATEYAVRQAARRQLEGLGRQLPTQVLLDAVERGRSTPLGDLAATQIPKQPR